MKSRIIKLIGRAKLLVCGWIFLSLAPVAHADYVRTYVTQANGAKLMAYATSRTTRIPGNSSIVLQDETTFQSIDGFGYALTYSSCYNLMQMAERERLELIRRTFSPITGFGVSYVRISIGCSDFSSREYTLCDREGLENFSLQSDEVDYVIPVLKEVLRVNPGLKIMAAPWTCPRWMKVRNKGGSTPYISWTGGYLNPAHRETYAQYFVKFVQAMQQEGIPIYAVTPQNEPLNGGNSSSLLLPWDDEAALINCMAPAFKQAGLNTKIYCFDHNWNYDNKADQIDYPIKVYNALDKNLEGMELVMGSAWHDYGGSPSEMEDIYQKAPDKELIFTESSIGEWNDGRNLSGKLLSTTKSLTTNLLTRHCRAVIVWNFMLDLEKGPNLDGGCQICYGALDIDSEDYHTITANSHFFAMAHSSAVIKPGAVRIDAMLNAVDGVTCVAFQNPDNTYGVLLVNEGVTRNISVVTPDRNVAKVLVPTKSIVSVEIGGEPDLSPQLGDTPLTLQSKGHYEASLEIAQKAVLEQNFLPEEALESWYVDPDYFMLGEDGQLTFLPVDGTYTVSLDLNARTLMCSPQALPLNAQGEGTLYANGIPKSHGKPCFFPGTVMSASTAIPMAQIEPGLHRLTLTEGEQMNSDALDMSFYADPSLENPFLATGGALSLSYDSQQGSSYFKLGRGTMGQQDGHLYKRTLSLKLTKGDSYVVTVDLRNGLDAGKIWMKKYDPSASGISDLLHTEDKAGTSEEEIYDLSGRRVGRVTSRGIYITRGKKTLVQ